MFLFNKKLGLVLLAVMFTAASCGLIGGGGGGEAKTIELTWWKPFDDARAVQPLIQAFQQKYPNVRITYVQKNIETYESELVDALAAGQGPDIFSIHNDWLPKHKAKMTPADANGPSLRDFREQFVQVAAADLTSGGLVYAVPLSVDALAQYYNRDILASSGVAQAPTTWQDLVAITPKLTRQDNLGNFQRSAVALGTADNINRAPDILGLLMLQNGTPFYSPDNTGQSLDQTVQTGQGQSYSPAESALQFYTQFADPAKVTYTWNTRSNNSIEAFASGQVGIIFSYSYLRSTLATRAPFLNYAVASAPQLTATGNKINYANYWAEGVSRQSKHQDAAWAFLKFITQKDVLKKYYEVQKVPSSRVDILAEQQSDPSLGVFAEAALSAKSFYKPQSDAVESVFVQMINDVVLRSVSPREAVSAAAKKFNLLLRNY